MRYEVICTRSRFDDIEPAWGVLWHDCGGSPFQSHAWMSAWCKENPIEARLHIVCAWHDQVLIGVLPLCIRSWHGLRVLEWAAQGVSDYCDALAAQDPHAVLDGLWRFLMQTGTFDIIRLKHIGTDAVAFPMLRHRLAADRVEHCLRVVRQWPNGAAWYHALNTKARTNHTRSKRILSDHGTVTFRQLAHDEPYEPVIRRLLEMKRQRIEHRTAPLVCNDTALLAMVKALDQIGSLRIFLLECAGTIIAGSVNAMQHDKMLVLFPAYDVAHKRAGPGIILMTEYIVWAFDHRVNEIDYLLGPEPYKFKFANQQVQTHILIGAKTWRGRCAVAAYRHVYPRPIEPVSPIGSGYLLQPRPAADRLHPQQCDALVSDREDQLGP